MASATDMTNLLLPAAVPGWHWVSVGGLLLLAAGSGLFLCWRRKRDDFLRRQHEAEARHIAAQARSAEELRDSEELFRAIAAAAQDAIVMLDEHGLVSFWNEAAERIFGYSGAEILGREFHAILPPERHRHDFRAAFPAFQKTGHGAAIGKTLELAALRRDGSEFPLELSLSAVRLRGGWHSVGIVRDITERKQAQEELLQQRRQLETVNCELDAINQELQERRRETETALATLHRSEFQLRALFDQAAVGMAQIDSRSGRFLKVNRRHAGIFGYTPQEMAAMTFEALLHPHDLPLFQKRMEAFRAGTINECSLEKRFLRKDGTTIWAALTVSPMWMPGEEEESHIAVVHEITERVQAEEKLLKLSRAVENSPATVVITDRNGIIEYVNPKFTETSGYLPEEAIGKNPRILKAGELPAEFYRELWTTIRGGNEWRGVFCNRKKNGEIHWEQASISPIRDDCGEIAHFVAVKEDITEAKRTAEELQRAKEAADAASRFKSEFLANMSHEIRTPLNAIIGFSSLALKSELPDPQRDYLDKIGNAGASLLKIVNDILDFSKVEAGKLSMERIGFHLEAVVANAVSVVQQRAEEKGLRLGFEISPRIPEHLLGDPYRLGQVLANLLSNAVKFTQAGEVELKAGLLRQQEKKVQLEFAVRDTGVGMNAAQLASLFQPFTQADGSITRKFGGTGLGLAISRQLVELMGGRIGCVSAPGEGSTFRFTVELELADGAAVAIAADRKAPGEGPPDLSGARILLVEDNEINRQLALELLKETGAAITMANNGREAVELVIEREGAFDLVLMDIQMPVMDGYEATRRIRAERRLQSLPIVAMTAHALVEEQKRILEAGMDSYISKPIEAQKLLQTIAACLGRRPAIPPPGPAGEKAEAPVDLPEIPGVDTAGALARMDGDRELYLWVLQAFVDTHADSAAAILQALGAGDRSAVERLVHTVKGNAGSVGARGLQDAALLLESALRRHAPPEELQDCLERFRQALEQLMKTLGQVLPAPEPGRQSAGADQLPSG